MLLLIVFSRNTLPIERLLPPRLFAGGEGARLGSGVSWMSISAGAQIVALAHLSPTPHSRPPTPRNENRHPRKPYDPHTWTTASRSPASPNVTTRSWRRRIFSSPLKAH